MRTIPARYGPELVAALVAALDGTGPAVLPLPSGAEGSRLRTVLRPDLPVEVGIALVVPTSGSTGDPKGVLLSAAALEASAAATERRLGGPGRWTLALPVTHIAGLQVVLRALRAGSPPVPVNPGPPDSAPGPAPDSAPGPAPDSAPGRAPDSAAAAASGGGAAGFVAATEALGAGRRYTSLVPTQLRRLLAAGPAALDALRSYDAVLLGGAAPPAALLTVAREAGVNLVVTYGMSETCGGCVYDGLPLDGVTVDLDATDRIRLGGPVLARGYRLRPELTAQAFAGGRFITGDVGRLDLARLTVLGRADDVLVTGGEKVAPAAVEAALAEHPAVAEAAVIGVADEEWGQRVVAVVVLRDGAGLTLEEARRQVAERVSRVAAPRELRVVDALPLLPSGKLDRVALR
ncbi:MAG TPA: AMP-binding protein [Mycobacteriales bacterium]|nr:AMP-binding protein [Mycobacteriales bacterium]